MARPLRIEFPGAVYYVTSRGHRRESIFAEDEHHVALQGIVEQGLERFDAQMLAYCLIGNHYHFVLHTRSANLSLLMHQFNGVYSHRYNFRLGLMGHLLQGRFKAILVDRDADLLEVCRYVELNPVRAAVVVAPAASLRQRGAPKRLSDWLRERSRREEAMWMAACPQRLAHDSTGG